MSLSLALVLGLTLAAQTDPLRRLPATIEVLRDVTVGRGPDSRTRLTVTGDDSDEFIIKKGERFPKGGRHRYVRMTSRLAAALRQHRHLRSPRVLC